MDIIVYTTQEVLEHKKEDGKYSEDCYCYWEFAKFPKYDFKRMYFAVKGYILGYFKIRKDGFKRKYNTIHFDSDSWVNLKKPIPQKPFQGFKYFKPH